MSRGRLRETCWCELESREVSTLWEFRRARAIAPAGFLFRAYQSSPSVSPPAGVHAAHQVSGLMLPETSRALPSAREINMPADLAAWGSQ
jgi:hypothetical protein